MSHGTKIAAEKIFSRKVYRGWRSLTLVRNQMDAMVTTLVDAMDAMVNSG